MLSRLQRRWIAAEQFSFFFKVSTAVSHFPQYKCPFFQNGNVSFFKFGPQSGTVTANYVTYEQSI